MAVHMEGHNILVAVSGCSSFGMVALFKWPKTQRHIQNFFDGRGFKIPFKPISRSLLCVPTWNFESLGLVLGVKKN